MNRVFLRLLESYFVGRPLAQTSFDRAVHRFFGRPGLTNDEHQAYFSNFTLIGEALLAQKRHLDAEQVWELALNPA